MSAVQAADSALPFSMRSISLRFSLEIKEIELVAPAHEMRRSVARASYGLGTDILQLVEDS